MVVKFTMTSMVTILMILIKIILILVVMEVEVVVTRAMMTAVKGTDF